jgi:hypothetical protein
MNTLFFKDLTNGFNWAQNGLKSFFIGEKRVGYISSRWNTQKEQNETTVKIGGDFFKHHVTESESSTLKSTLKSEDVQKELFANMGKIGDHAKWYEGKKMSRMGFGVGGYYATETEELEKEPVIILEINDTVVLQSTARKFLKDLEVLK